MIKELRFHPSIEEQRLSTIVDATQKGKPKLLEFEKRTGEPGIPFQRGDLDIKTPDFVKLPFVKAILDDKSNYPVSSGQPELKSSLTEYIKRKGIDKITESYFTITSGGQDGLTGLVAFFRNGKGAGFGPCWSCMLDNMVPNAQIDFRLVPLKERNGRLTYDKSELEEAIKGRDFFYLNTPHNPTGKVFSEEEVREVNDICLRNGVFVISDEAYNGIIFDGKRHFSTLETENDLSASVFTFSKTFAVTGYRIGYTVSRHPHVNERLSLMNYTATAGISTPTQFAFANALKREKDVGQWETYVKNTLQKRRDLAYDILKESFPTMPKPEGAFYLFPNFNPLLGDREGKDNFVFEELLKDGVLIAPGSGFGKEYEGFQRISYSMLGEQLIGIGCSRINNFVNNLKIEA